MSEQSVHAPITDFGLDHPFKTVVEQAADAVFIGAPDGRIFYANPAACRLFGAEVRDFVRIGRPGISDPDDSVWHSLLAERRSNGTARGIARMVRLDGTRLMADVSSTIFQATGGEERSCVIVRDVTEQVRMERRLEAYDQITAALLAGKDPKEALALIARHACVIFDATFATISIPAPDGLGLVVAGAHGPAVSDMVGTTYPLGGLGAKVMDAQQPILIDDFRTLTRWPEIRELEVGPGMAVPIISEDDSIGALAVAAPDRHPGYTVEDLDAAQQYAARAGITLALGLARAEAERHLRLNTERLQEALNTRIVIEQAKGLLAGVHSVTPDEAFGRLRRYARSHNADIHLVARKVVERQLIV